MLHHVQQAAAARCSSCTAAAACCIMCSKQLQHDAAAALLLLLQQLAASCINDAAGSLAAFIMQQQCMVHEMEVYYHNNHNTGPMRSLMVTLMRSCRQNVPTVIWGLPIDGEPVSGTDLERTSVQWQEYCMQYIGFAPEDGALKGSRLQIKAIIEHISHVHITPDTPHLTVVQYARAVAFAPAGGTMCPDSSGNLVSLLYLAKLEDIVAARNYSWGSAVLAFLYRELCNASEKGKAVIGGALQLVQIWAWSRIIPLCPGLGAPRVHMGPYQIDNNRVLPGAPYGAMWNLEMHHPERVLRQFGMMQNIPDQPDTRDMSLHKSPVPIVRAQIGFCSTYSTSLDGKDDMTRSYKDNPFPTEEIQIEDIGNGYNNITRHFVSSSTDRRVESGYQPGDAPMLQIVDYYVPQPSQDDWFQSTSYMPSHAEAYSSHVDLDLGLGINQPYAPEYNISPVPFPSFSAYRDNVESSSAASSSGLHINSGGDDNDGQNEPIQNMGEEIRRPRRQRHRRNCGTGGHF
ncbi:protein MAINTENANCE OF MERISTEMS [Sesamum angolense]|uniref:Protein MAINTENANCE OF MERISTEMS n=1 Tax=Sesamum angolense TaxID=2727404 RepID=A0AAE1XF09_9LAMI|nr:protein MAINTENANCE OF MERISTEMS [Sesamum angolense]